MKISKYILFSLFTGLLLSGCYTIVQHPQVENKDENGYTVNRNVDFYDDCNSCHTENGSQSYTAMSDADIERAHRPLDSYNDEFYYERGGYYDYGYGSNIGYYYNRPWWYDFRYSGGYSDEDSDDRKGNESTTRLRDNDGGRSSSRDGRRSTSGSSTVDRPGVSTSSGGSSSNGGSRPSTSTRSTDSSSSDNNSSGDRSRTERTSSSERSSSDQPRTRDNDGGRSSSGGGRSSGGSGRR